MRIALVNWSRRRVGGVESYLNTVIPELIRAGHEIAFWYEIDEPSEREQIRLPPDAAAWCAAELGMERALSALRDWRPEVIYTHKVSDPKLERTIIGVAPSVFFAHDYNGTCISGDKTFKYPTVKPCDRRFGWRCLLHYYPHRCGGLNPLTMLKLYDVQARRLENLHQYDAIVTHSDHMLSELIKHGLSPRRAYNFPYYVQNAEASENSFNELAPNEFATQDAYADTFALPSEDGDFPARADESHASWNLLFSGRMERLKGGDFFIDALSSVAARLERPLSVTFAGEGRQRRAWEERAAKLRNHHLNFEFVGWIDRPKMSTLLEACDLLVVPSLWPEPFGLVGPEAGMFGVPVAAFAVGGIPDWLVNGINGYLAPGDPPTSKGLADAIFNCLHSPATHQRLRRGAIEVARQFNIRNHLKALLEVFEKVASSR
jgi:glycosyltransferase involved in cell wall biosynthesis